MDIIGTIIAANAQRSGTSANGTQWTSQEFVADVSQPGAQYPSHLVFTVFGADKLQQFSIQLNCTYRIFYDFRGRQTADGRWFGSVQAWKIEPHNAQTQTQTQTQQFPQQPYQPQPQQPYQQPQQYQPNQPGTQPGLQAAPGEAIPF